MRGFLIGILVLGLVLIGGGAIAATAYQAGLTQAVTTTVTHTADGTTTVAPVVVPAYAYGYGFGWHGFGFFGFFGFLIVFFIVFALIRAIIWGGRGGWGRGGWGRGGWYGPGGPGSGGPGGPGKADHYGRWGGGWGQAHDVFSDWHREAHSGETPDAAPRGETPGTTNTPGPTSGSAG